MKIIKKVLSIILVIVFSFMFVCCGRDFYYADFSCFKTNVHVETYGKKLDEQTLESIKNVCFSLEERFDYDGENSIPTMLNNADIGEKIRVTPDCFTLLKKSVDLNQFTNGAFNPLITPLTELWGFKNKVLKPTTIPSQNDIDSILNSNLLDIENLELIDGEVSKKDNLNLDLGGLVKGYASQKAMDVLLEKGFDKCYVNFGGSSLSLIGMPTLRVIHPTKSHGEILEINLDKKHVQHVSTSGDYENYYEIDKKRYSHIINPLNGYPTDTGVRSATVILDDGAFADGITTALCLMDYYKDNHANSPLVLLAQKIIVAYPKACIYVVYEKGEDKILLTNKKQNENFILLDTEYTVVNI